MNNNHIGRAGVVGETTTKTKRAKQKKNGKQNNRQKNTYIQDVNNKMIVFIFVVKFSLFTKT